MVLFIANIFTLKFILSEDMYDQYSTDLYGQFH